MAKNQDNALRLMVVDDSMEDAEATVSALRNAGIAVRPLRPATPEELAGMFSGQGIDLVIAAVDSTNLPLEEVARQVQASGKDLPLLAVAGSIDAESFSRAHGHGVRRIVLRDNPQLLLNAVRDERNDLEARRALRLLEARVRETERRCDALIDSSRDPIAYIHEGMHIRANGAYLEMFGYESFEDVEGMSLLDMVAPQHVEEFKDLLKRLAKGEPPPARHDLEARDIEGNGFPASMEFTPAQYEGEPCLQVIFRREEVDPELARQVEELRQRDQVTGLLNRPTFLRRLAWLPSARRDEQVALHHAARCLERVGLGGLLTELGARPVRSARLMWRGRTLQVPLRGMVSVSRHAMDAGIAYLPEDRKTEGLMLPMSISDNLLAASYGRVSSGPFIDPGKAQQAVEQAITQLRIKIGSPEDPVATLSGGNQQKVVIAKWLMTQPEVILLNDPTRGIDVGTKQELYRLMRDLADPEVWIERYETPTWLDYIRHNSRLTHDDAAVPEHLRALHRGSGPPRVRRMIERQPSALHTVPVSGPQVLTEPTSDQIRPS